MAEHAQNRLIHLVMSVLTIVMTLAGVTAGYWSVQSSNREFMVELRASLGQHTQRIDKLEANDARRAGDRIDVERRITSLETFYVSTLAAILEIKTDIRSLRQEVKRP